MMEAHELTKRYGDTIAVHSLSVTIAPGTVTGFLGPNGAGKSTTMRMIMGLDRPTSGTVTVNGKPYRRHRAPLREVGALLEASAVHPGRSARSHLRSMAATHNIKASRVSEVSAGPDLPPLRRTDRSSRKEPMTIPTKTPNLLDNPPVIRPQRRSKR